MRRILAVAAVAAALFSTAAHAGPVGPVGGNPVYNTNVFQGELSAFNTSSGTIKYLLTVGKIAGDGSLLTNLNLTAAQISTGNVTSGKFGDNRVSISTGAFLTGFNGASQLVQMDSSGNFPVANMPVGNVNLSTVAAGFVAVGLSTQTIYANGGASTTTLYSTLFSVKASTGYDNSLSRAGALVRIDPAVTFGSSVTFSGASQFGGTLLSLGQIIDQGSITVTGATQLAGLSVSGQETVGSSLTVVGQFAAGGAASLNGATTVVGSSLTVGGAFGSTGTGAFNGTLTVAGSSFTVTGAGQFGGTLLSLGQLIDQGSMTVSGATQLAGLSVSGQGTVSSTLTVVGAAQFGGTLLSVGQFIDQGSMTVSGASQLAGLSVSGQGTISSTFTVVGASQFGGTLLALGQAVHQGSMTVAGATQLASLSVSGQETVSGSSLTVVGQLVVGGATTMSAPLTLLNSSATIGGAFSATGTGAFGGAVTVQGSSLTVGGAFSANGAGLFTGPLTVLGSSLTVGGAFGASGAGSFGGALTVVGSSLTVGGAGKFTGDLLGLGQGIFYGTMTAYGVSGGVSFVSSANVQANGFCWPSLGCQYGPAATSSVGGGGNAGFLSYFSAGTTLANADAWYSGSSTTFETGQLAVGTTFYVNNARVGIGVAIPGTTLDVNGGATIRGQETLTSSMTVLGAGGILLASGAPIQMSGSGGYLTSLSSGNFTAVFADLSHGSYSGDISLNGNVIAKSSVTTIGGLFGASLTVSDGPATFNSSVSTGIISKGFSKYGGAGSAQGEIQIGGSLGASDAILAYDATTSGDLHIDNNTNSSAAKIIFGMRTNGGASATVPLIINGDGSVQIGGGAVVSTFNATGSLTVGSTLTVNSQGNFNNVVSTQVIIHGFSAYGGKNNSFALMQLGTDNTQSARLDYNGNTATLAIDNTFDASPYFTNFNFRTSNPANALTTLSLSSLGNAVVIASMTAAVVATPSLIVSNTVTTSTGAWIYRSFASSSEGMPMLLLGNGQENQSAGNLQVIGVAGDHGGSERPAMVFGGLTDAAGAGKIHSFVVMNRDIATAGMALTRKFQISGYGVITSSGTSPTVTCDAGIGVMGVNSNSNFGRFVAGTAATTCTVTFPVAWPQTPDCDCYEKTSLVVVRPSATSTASFSCAGVTISNDTIGYRCSGVPQ